MRGCVCVCVEEEFFFFFLLGKQCCRRREKRVQREPVRKESDSRAHKQKHRSKEQREITGARGLSKTAGKERERVKASAVKTTRHSSATSLLSSSGRAK